MSEKIFEEMFEEIFEEIFGEIFGEMFEEIFDEISEVMTEELYESEGMSKESSESEDMSEEIFEEISEVMFEEPSESEYLADEYFQNLEVMSKELSGPEEFSKEGIIGEYFDDLNRLIEKGDHEAVQAFIQENQIKPGVIYRYFHLCFGNNFKRRCPVGLAARCGHVQVMKTLIDAGFLVNERSAYFEEKRPIHLACERGNTEIVKTLVEEYNVDVTHRENCDCRPAVCIVADNGNLEIMRYFIEKAHIPVNSRYGENKDSALHAAAENDRIAVCKYLISKGADINIRDTYNHTPLMLAAKNESYNLARVLLDAGADVNITDDGQETAFFKTADQGDMKMMKLLQSCRSDPELYEGFFTSRLYNAIGDNRRDVVFYLVNELNVRIRPIEYYGDEWYGVTVCRMALGEHHYDMVKLLFNAGYDPSRELSELRDSDDDNSSTGSSEDFDSISPRKKRNSFPLPREVKLKELRKTIARPRSLLALSVLTVRRLLGRRLPVDLERLPLPDILKNIIVSCGEEKP